MRVDKPAYRLNGKKLRRLREDKGFKSQSALARALKVRPSTVQRWEEGEATPEGASLVDLSRLLDVTPDSLFDHEHSPGLKAAVLAQVQEVFGRAAADAITQLDGLTDHHRSIVTGRIQGWCEALAMMEKGAEAVQTPTARLPPTRYDIERAQDAANGGATETDPPVSGPQLVGGAGKKSPH